MLNIDVKDSDTGAVLLMKKCICRISQNCVQYCFTLFTCSVGRRNTVPSTKIQTVSKVYESMRPQSTYFECHRC